jgi:amino-acid N-acetyltransferase
MDAERDFVEWFRRSAPYINAHRGRVFVVQIEGEAIEDPGFAGLVHDFALLESLGVRLVLVHGARPQIERRLAERGLLPRRVGGRRVTPPEALAAVVEASGSVRVEIEARLSMGLPNSPMAGARLRVACGNFVTARPIGVRDGVDFQHTGEVRRVDVSAIKHRLDDDAIVLLSPLGYSPTGEVFSLRAEEVATAAALELRAAKLIFLVEGAGLALADGITRGQLTLEEAKSLHAARRQDRAPADSDDAGDLLAHAIHACRNGVARSHVLERRIDGALLLELFSRDGIGTMISADAYETTRRASIDHVGGVLALIHPLEAQGKLVRRSREKLETEIERFFVMERDGTVIACAAAYPFPDESVVELACLAVHDAYRAGGRGDVLLGAVEDEARALGATRLFVLTTQAVHWFKERGFEDAALESLPVERRLLYNYERNSKVLIKTLVPR